MDLGGCKYCIAFPNQKRAKPTVMSSNIRHVMIMRGQLSQARIRQLFFITDHKRRTWFRYWSRKNRTPRFQCRTQASTKLVPWSFCSVPTPFLRKEVFLNTHGPNPPMLLTLVPSFGCGTSSLAVTQINQEECRLVCLGSGWAHKKAEKNTQPHTPTIKYGSRHHSYHFLRRHRVY